MSVQYIKSPTGSQILFDRKAHVVYIVDKSARLPSDPIGALAEAKSLAAKGKAVSLSQQQMKALTAATLRISLLEAN
jgi:hypothetical protein